MESLAEIIKCQQPKPNGLRDSSATSNAEFDERIEFAYCPGIGLIPAETPRQLNERLIASGFPIGLAELTFDDLTVDEFNREKLQKAKAFAEAPAGGLYICGEFGTGKTWLAAAIGTAVARNRKRVMFGTFTEITDKLIEAQRYNSFSAEWSLYVSKPDLLIVDDIGKEKPSEWKLQTLFRLIDERGSANLPTIFTSNYGLDRLCERISPDNDDGITAGAIKDRLKCFAPLMLTGGSRRR